MFPTMAPTGTPNPRGRTLFRGHTSPASSRARSRSPSSRSVSSADGHDSPAAATPVFERIDFLSDSDGDVFDAYADWCNNPGQFAVFAYAWQKLPRELQDYILELLSSPFMDKGGPSKLSLVSRDWSLRFRPLLFTQLELRTPDDVRQLDAILRSPLSGWLKDHVAELTFYSHSFFAPLALALLALLPERRTIHIDSDDTTGPPFLYAARLKQSLRCMTKLKLSNFKLHSFHGLFRVIGSVTTLEVLHLTRVTWPNDPFMARGPGPGAFPNIRTVHMLSCTDNLSLPALIYSATSTQYSSSRPRQEIPAETRAVVEILHGFLQDSRIQSTKFQTVQTTPDSYTFVGSLRTTSTSTTPCPLDFVLAEIAMQTVKHVSLEDGGAKWLVREMALAEGLEAFVVRRTSYMYTRQWGYLTTTLPVLRHIKHFHILCGPRHAPEGFASLKYRIANGTLDHPSVTIRHDDLLPDARFMEPALFGLAELNEVHEGEGEELANVRNTEAVEVRRRRGLRSPARRPLRGPRPDAADVQAPDSSKTKRVRARLTPTQLTILQAVFQESQFPSEGRRLEIAESIGLKARVVQIWFQNQRMKEKMRLTRPPEQVALDRDAASAPPARESQGPMTELR
ncbi:homeobox domain-containing protein [Phanerochaete sordida]|uniref:Homeobox domain-containing protein n=1 Tax=Phanerochaete sordida TaxID=48140 RepID=A0A9P3G887_9APHY|nr:homeobox domain-containing protein [Phanerochaete sordida]